MIDHAFIDRKRATIAQIENATDWPFVECSMSAWREWAKAGKASTMHIKVREQTLTDGSKVYDVVLITDGAAMQLQAYSESDAWQLLDTLTDAINKHTVETIYP